MLAVYFEETAQYQAEQMKESRSRSSGSGGDYTTDGEIGSDDTPELYEDDEDE